MAKVTIEFETTNPMDVLDAYMQVGNAMEKAFPKWFMKKPETPISPIKTQGSNTCPSCGCIYDDKQVGAQGRDGSCQCYCGHRSDWSNRT